MTLQLPCIDTEADKSNMWRNDVDVSQRGGLRYSVSCRIYNNNGRCLS